MRFNICNKASGADLGTYEGDKVSAALDAMAHDAGYRDYAEACDVAPPLMGEIIITEVPEPMAAMHTETPWKWHVQGEANEYCLLTDKNNGWVLSFRQNGEMMVAQQRANAEFIVTACNAHDQLVALAREMEAFSEAAMMDAEEEGDTLGVITWRARQAHCLEALAAAGYDGNQKWNPLTAASPITTKEAP